MEGVNKTKKTSFRIAGSPAESLPNTRVGPYCQTGLLGRILFSLNTAY
jgi:hypothetical protein